MAARRVATSGGISWQIDPSEVRTLRTSAAIDADTPNETETQNTRLGADTADKVRTGADIPSDALLSHVLEENRRLWAALEAAQQSEAVTKAALREALRAMPKALSAPSPEGDLAQLETQKRGDMAPVGQVGTDSSARIAPQRPQNGEGGTYGPKASDGPQTGGKGDGAGVSYASIADELDGMLNQ